MRSISILKYTNHEGANEPLQRTRKTAPLLFLTTSATIRKMHESMKP